MTKKEMVLKHLQEHKKITPLEALREYGSMRLGAIIFDLRKENHRIYTKNAKKTLCFKGFPFTIESYRRPIKHII